MKNSKKNTEKSGNTNCRRLKINPRTGLPVITGPSFTKEDIDRDFPKGSGRDAVIMRRSVGLPTGLLDG